MEENEMVIEIILNTYEAILGKKEENSVILQEISKNNENFIELKKMIINLDRGNCFNCNNSIKIEDENKFEALDIVGKENRGNNFHKMIKLEDQDQPHFAIGNIRNCLDEIRKAVTSANYPKVNLILSDVFIVDSLGVKSALGRTYYHALTAFNPLS